jgi:hypothetical protein
MRIIALRGGNSCGKTTTLNLVYDDIINKNGGVSTSKKQEGGDKKDFSDIVNYKGLKIAFFTMGDFSIHTINAINKYDGLGVDVLVLASNIKFVKPIRLIMSYTHNLINKTIASNHSLEATTNQSDAAIIFSMI